MRLNKDEFKKVVKYAKEIYGDSLDLIVLSLDFYIPVIMEEFTDDEFLSEDEKYYFLDGVKVGFSGSLPYDRPLFVLNGGLNKPAEPDTVEDLFT